MNIYLPSFLFFLRKKQNICLLYEYYEYFSSQTEVSDYNNIYNYDIT